MYKNKVDCKRHYELLEQCTIQQDQFYKLNSKTVTLTSLPEVMTNLFILFQDQQNKLAQLVEDRVINVEQYFYDVAQWLIAMQKDIGLMRKNAIKNDPALSADQKVSLVADGASYDTLEGSLHTEMTQKALESLLKRSGGNPGLFGLGPK